MIHKKGAKNTFENYSITSIIYKLMESKVKDKIISHYGTKPSVLVKATWFCPSQKLYIKPLHAWKCGQKC